jgi:hypothetical protein
LASLAAAGIINNIYKKLEKPQILAEIKNLV